MVIDGWTGGNPPPRLSMEAPGGSIQSGEVHVWWLVPPGGDDQISIDSFAASTTIAERVRAGRFYFEADCWAYLTAQALLRHTLGEQLNTSAPGIEFVRTPQGRPFLRETAAGLHFSLSHTRGLVACALAAEEFVGIDVENPQRRQQSADLAAHYFDPRESSHLASATPELRVRDFFLQWTLKEAFLKAIGAGLHAPLDTLAVIPRNGSLDCSFTRPFPGPSDRWSFWAAMVEGFRIALAFRSTIQPVIRLGRGPKLWLEAQTQSQASQPADRRINQTL